MTGRPPPVQGEDDIVIDAPVATVWRLIAGSLQLERWGPPVRQVTVLDQPEILGSRRVVVAEFAPGGGVVTASESAHAANKQTAHFEERRTEHIEGRKVGYRIEKEDIGMFRVISDVGYTTELEPLGQDRTKVTWRFFHRPRGIFGIMMNRLHPAATAAESPWRASGAEGICRAARRPGRRGTRCTMRKFQTGCAMRSRA